MFSILTQTHSSLLQQTRVWAIVPWFSFDLDAWGLSQ
jgi:hypothetical protein